LSSLVDHGVSTARRAEEERVRIEEKAIVAGLSIVRKTSLGKGQLERNRALALLEMDEAPHAIVERHRSHVLALAAWQQTFLVVHS